MKPQEKSEALFRPSKEQFRMVTPTWKANLGSECIILHNRMSPEMNNSIFSSFLFSVIRTGGLTYF